MDFIKSHLAWIVVGVLFGIGFSLQAVMWFNLNLRATEDRTAILNIENFLQQATQQK